MSGALADLFVTPDIEKAEIEIQFTAPAAAVKVAWRVMDERDVFTAGDSSVAAGELTSIKVAMPGFRLWSVDSPFLYRLELDFGGGVLARASFGMRTIRKEGRDILVNNEKFYARGFIRGREAHDHPNLAGLSTTGYYEKNIRAAKAYGFNLIRFHSRIPDDECFEVADRLGIFIHIEIRKYFGKYQKERARMKDEGEIIDEAAWREQILRLRNHPSLMVYCMGNEIRHPGRNPFVEHIAEVTRELDPTRLFIDTCAHGEFDREYVDFDVQHMSYFYPFGKDYDMFENTYNWLIYGSCKGMQLDDRDDPDNPSYQLTRAINASRPTLAHEICHYVALRDLSGLEAKFARYGAEKPWWIDELKKLVAAKGLEADYPLMREASKHFQFISWKLGIEAVRRSALLTGFHFLQLSDTDRYENSNGILDCFDDSTGIDEAEFAKFNSSTVLLTDLPRRTYFEGERVAIPVLLSHYDGVIAGDADFSFRLEEEGVVLRSGAIKGIGLEPKGLRKICQLELLMPETGTPRELKLVCRLDSVDGSFSIDNDWNVWVFPDRPAELPAVPCRIALNEVDLSRRYPQLTAASGNTGLMVAERFSKPVFEHLEGGGDVLMLYRVPETRSRKRAAAREEYYFPATWDRFKGVIWDRGHNCGAFVREHPSFAGFPGGRFMDLRFHGIVDDCDKLVLDDFPVPVEPVMQGVDKAVRDRFDVFTYQLSELQPEWTMRKFAYAIELKVGAGRLYMTGFNFTGIDRGCPEACAMFESIWRYVISDDFKPKAEISPSRLEAYLARKGREPRVKERKMTQYWQLNEEPLESARYWEEAEEFIAGD